MTDDRSAESAEYALGLPDAQEARALHARIRSDPAFARDVARWRGRFATLSEEVDPVPAPAALWQRIDRSVGGSGERDDKVVALRRRLQTWRALAGGMTALAASLAILFLVDRRIPSAPAPPPSSAAAAEPMVAMIKAGTGVAAVASWDKSTRRLLVSSVNMPAVPDRSYELWVIPGDGKPRSIGVMPNAPQMRVSVNQPMSAMLAEGSTLAVSLEPLGGSPTGAPTGQVVASGSLASA